jgi:hypothetical protein
VPFISSSTPPAQAASVRNLLAGELPKKKECVGERHRDQHEGALIQSGQEQVVDVKINAQPQNRWEALSSVLPTLELHKLQREFKLLCQHSELQEMTVHEVDVK